MSHLHVTYKGKKRSYHLDDGKSGLLDRYIDLDKGHIYYTMGKQISGKPINPNGSTGKKLFRIAMELASKDFQKPKKDVFVRKAWAYDIYKTPKGEIVYKKNGKTIDIRPYDRRSKWAVFLFLIGFIILIFSGFELFLLFLLGFICLLVSVFLLFMNIF